MNKISFSSPKIGLLAFVLILLIAGCKDRDRGELMLQLDVGDNHKLTVPFNLIDSFHFQIINDEEVIDITDVRYERDSVFFKMPVFGTEFKGLVDAEGFHGYWYNTLKSSSYKIPFDVGLVKWNAGKADDFEGRYKVTFVDEDLNITPAVGVFEQDGNELKGTFQTETGDYRYLTGWALEDRMMLSTFDGSHAFFFSARKEQDDTLKGLFKSGTHWREGWEATPDNDFELQDMTRLTYLKNDSARLNFRKLDLNGKYHSLDDSLYKNKVCIVQIMGTWCPNCMDETRFLMELYNEYHNEGLEIVALDFEPDTSFEYFSKRAGEFKRALKVEYPILKAGKSKKAEAQKELPMLNQIISYPTAIFIDRNGEVREIHTGFSGPGTGDPYKEYMTKTTALLELLLNEEISSNTTE